MALLVNDKFSLENIPDIGSNRKLLELVMLQGASATWEGNTVNIDTTKVDKPQIIPAELFYYTSGAIFLIPILAHRFGTCILETLDTRDDTGGCQIGSREFSIITNTLKELGINHTRENNQYHFFVDSLAPFEYTVPVRSFSASVNSVIAALFKKGTSKISKITGEADFDDTIRMLMKMGAKIKQEGDILFISGQQGLHGVQFFNMFDRHDFITFLSSALTTNSEITICNIDHEIMKLDALDEVISQMGIQLEYSANSCYVPSQLSTLKPVNIVAGLYPNFITEWQVLFSPLLTQIKGDSKVVETVFANRMRHWEELGKMRARYEFYTDSLYPEAGNNPRAVRVTGPVELREASVKANDVRAGAALIIAGLAARGKTVVSNTEQIHRGYEHLVERLQLLGADIKYIS